MGATPAGGREKRRKSYAKPVVKRVHLKPEEAVLGGCKTAGAAGPAHGQCTVPTPCSTVAS